MKVVASFHYLTQDVEHSSHVALARAACRAGVPWIQFRSKTMEKHRLLRVAREMVTVCRSFGCSLIINDYCDIAAEVGACGVHLGSEDATILAARKMLGPDAIIGATANSFQDIVTHASAGADYIGLGPFRFTKSKAQLSPVLGIQGFSSIMRQVRKQQLSIPIVAIGGIEAADIELIMTCGVHGVAASSAIHRKGFARAVAKEFLMQVNTHKSNDDRSVLF